MNLKVLQKKTVQSSNDIWFDYRQGVITASVSNNVLTKYKILHPSVISVEKYKSFGLSPKRLKLHHCHGELNVKDMLESDISKQNRRMHKQKFI